MGLGGLQGLPPRNPHCRPRRPAACASARSPQSLLHVHDSVAYLDYHLVWIATGQLFRTERLAVHHRDPPGPGQKLPSRPRLESTLDTHRHDGCPCLLGQQNHARPHRADAAVVRSGRLGKRHNHIACAKPAEHLLDGTDICLAAPDRYGVQRPDKPSEPSIVEQAVPCQIRRLARQRDRCEDRIKEGLVITRQYNASPPGNAAYIYHMSPEQQQKRPENPEPAESPPEPQRHKVSLRQAGRPGTHSPSSRPARRRPPCRLH